VFPLQYGKTGYTDPITGVLVTAKEVMATADSKWNEERHCYKYEDVQMLDGTHAKHLLYNLRDVWKIVVHYEMVYDAIKECHIAVRHKKSDVTKKKVKDRYFNISEDLCKIFVKKCPWCTKDEDNQVATFSVPATSTRSTGFRDSCTACVVDYSAYPIIDGHGEFMNFLLVLSCTLRITEGLILSVIVTEFRYGTVTISESLKLTNMIQKFSVFFAIISVKSHSITKFLYGGR